MFLKKKDHNIIYWSKLIENYKNYDYSNNQIIINNKIYFLLLLLFKHFILKDISTINFNTLLNIYNCYIYNDVLEFRLYYLLYHIIIENKLIKFLWFLHIQLIENQKFYWINNSYNYFHENYIHIYIYLLSKKQKFLLNYSKYKYYNPFITLKKIFIYKEFILKVDYMSMYIYTHYIEYFRKMKYNEYISNNILLWNYPKLRNFLVIRLKKGIRYRKKDYRNMVLLNFYNIYYIITNLKSYIKSNSIISTNNNTSMLLKEDSLLFINNKLHIDNKNLIFKLINLNLFRFINFVNPIIYYKLIKLFKKILLIYITFISHEIYNRYFLLSEKLRKIRFRHIISLHYKYENLQYKFISFIFKYYWKYYNNTIFSNHILINYGFLSFYCLENNIYIMNYIRKNILIYRIINIFLIKYINNIFKTFFNYIDVESHKANSFKNPALQKMWNINYIKNWKNKSYIHSPIYSNVFKGYNYENKINNIKSYNKNMPIPKNYYVVNINWNFIFFWKAIIKWSFIKFYNIVNYINDEIGLHKILSNYKYSVELIHWKIMNSNNNKYFYYKEINQFNLIFKNIKLTNIINVNLKKYFNTIMNYFIKYSKDHLINISLCYSILKDFFINVYDNKLDCNNKYKLDNFMKKNLCNVNKYKKNYNHFFLWQIKNFLSLLRFREYYIKHEYTYYMEYYIPITYTWEKNYKLWLDNLHKKMIDEWEKN